MNVSLCQVEFSATGRSHIQSPAECVCAIECDQMRATGTLYTYNERVEKEERKKERKKYGRYELFPTCFVTGSRHNYFIVFFYLASAVFLICTRLSSEAS